MDYKPQLEFDILFSVSIILSMIYSIFAIRPSLLSTRLAFSKTLFSRFPTPLSTINASVANFSQKVNKKRAFVIIIATGITLGIFLALAEGNTGASVANFKFQNNLQDSSHHLYDALNHGAKFVSAKSGSALHFDGSKTYVEVPNPAILNSGNVTIGVWIMDYTPKGNDYSMVVTKGDGPNPTQGYSLRFGYNYDLRFMIGDGLSSKGTNPVKVDTFPAFVVATYDGSTVKLYVNGQLKTSKILDTHILYGNHPFGIGGSSDTRGHYLNGTIGDVMIYKKELSTFQIFLKYILQNIGLDR